MTMPDDTTPTTQPVTKKPTTKKRASPPKQQIKGKRTRGRPTVYSEAIAQEICERLASGEGLKRICRDDHMPGEVSVRRWALDPLHPFSALYARAREVQLWGYVDEIVEISDDSRNDYIARLNKSGESASVLNTENVQRSRLRSDNRKWILSKLLPKTFGDRIATEMTGKDGGPIQMENERPDTLATARWVADILLTGKAEAEKRKRADDEGEDKSQ